MKVRFWGTRGSIATPGPDTVHYGGNTSCVEVTTDSGDLLVLDCGTGAARLAAHLMAEGKNPITANILLGHTHWDHIQGFPFFSPGVARCKLVKCPRVFPMMK
jgi:phosphoribosyl 1,2-cyclic phosphodiesterase